MTETVNAGNRPNNVSFDIGKDQSVLLTSIFDLGQQNTWNEIAYNILTT